MHRLTNKKRQAGQTKPGVQTYRFAFFQPKRSEKQRECSGKQREARRSNGKQFRIDLQRSNSDQQASVKQGSGFATAREGHAGSHTHTHRRTFRASAAQPRKQHRLTGTRSFASPARTARTNEPNRIRFPGWTHPPTSDSFEYTMFIINSRYY